MTATDSIKIGIFNADAYANLYEAAGCEALQIQKGICSKLNEMERMDYDFVCLIHRPLVSCVNENPVMSYGVFKLERWSLLFKVTRFEMLADTSERGCEEEARKGFSFIEITTRKCISIGLNFFNSSIDPTETIDMIRSFWLCSPVRDLPLDRESHHAISTNLEDDEELDAYFDDTVHLVTPHASTKVNLWADPQKEKAIHAVLKRTLNTHVIMQIFGENCVFESISQYASFVKPREISIRTNEANRRKRWKQSVLGVSDDRGFIEIDRVKVASFDCQ